MTRQPNAASVVRPPVIGIVGGIGAGKSEVARALAELGCVVSDSDAEAHRLLASAEVRRLLGERWGDAVIEPSGAPDRRAIGRIVFSDATERVWLESVIHPRLHACRVALFAAHPEARAHVIDAPLLLEAGLGASCDAIIFVEAPDELRRARVRASRGWSPEELARRESVQWPLDRKRDFSHHVVCNEGDPASLRLSVGALLEKISPARLDP